MRTRKCILLYYRWLLNHAFTMQHYYARHDFRGQNSDCVPIFTASTKSTYNIRHINYRFSVLTFGLFVLLSLFTLEYLSLIFSNVRICVCLILSAKVCRAQATRTNLLNIETPWPVATLFVWRFWNIREIECFAREFKYIACLTTVDENMQRHI